MCPQDILRFGAIAEKDLPEVLWECERLEARYHQSLGDLHAGAVGLSLGGGQLRDNLALLRNLVASADKDLQARHGLKALLSAYRMRLYREMLRDPG